MSQRTAQRELSWLFNQAHSDLGINSSFGAIISQGCFSTSSDAVNHAEDKMINIADKHKSPIKKLRQIQKALNGLSKRDRRIIDACYSNYTFPIQLSVVFGEKVGAALFNETITSLKPLLSICHKKLAKLHLTLEEKSDLLKIEKERDQIFISAHEAYIKERMKS